MTAFNKAVFSQPGAGTIVDAFGRHTIRITAEQTGGALGCFEVEVPAGDGTPPHVHAAEDEFFRILDSRFAFWCNGERVDLEAGGTLFIPRGAVHRFQNIGPQTGRLMVVVTPGGFEGFFPAAARERPDTPEAIASLGQRFNLSFVLDAATETA